MGVREKFLPCRKLEMHRFTETCTSNYSSPTSKNKNNVININLENKRCKIGVFPSVQTSAQIY